MRRERRVIESSFVEGRREGGGEFGGKDIITGGLKRRGTQGISYYSKRILNTTQTRHQTESWEGVEVN